MPPIILSRSISAEPDGQAAQRLSPFATEEFIPRQCLLPCRRIDPYAVMNLISFLRSTISSWNILGWNNYIFLFADNSWFINFSHYIIVARLQRQAIEACTKTIAPTAWTATPTATSATIVWIAPTANKTQMVQVQTKSMTKNLRQTK